MGRIAGIRIENYSSLKDVKLGRLLFDDNRVKELTNMKDENKERQEWNFHSILRVS